MRQLGLGYDGDGQEHVSWRLAARVALRFVPRFRTALLKGSPALGAIMLGFGHVVIGIASRGAVAMT